jgi:mRNA-degrading endonuclease RelE of RelBE toxin-antitoxin system
MEGPFPETRGPYRIIFTLDRKAATVAISAILIRSEKTYR